MNYCYICYGLSEEDLICEKCDRHYCHDCSYTFTLHYQFQGGQCYKCSEQPRITKLEASYIRENIMNILNIN